MPYINGVWREAEVPVAHPIVPKPEASPHWWRPLMMRDPNERMQHGCMNRLIGLELRMRDPFGCQEEIMMVPLNIEIMNTGNASMLWEFGPNTLHTSAGDINIPSVQIRACGL